MRNSILAKIFKRVQVSDAEGRVLRVILSKTNSFGKHAKVAYACLAAITGYSVRHVKRLVKSLIEKRRLLRVTKRVLWPGHNAINIYDVVIPWRREVSFAEMGIGSRSYTRPDKVNDRGDTRCHPNTQTERKRLLQPAQVCSEVEASGWLTVGSGPWYHAQGLTPPGENGEKASHEG
jgi:hypothetical protein